MSFLPEIETRLECGHTVMIHAGSSTWDFPEEGDYCDRCKEMVPLAKEVIDDLKAADQMVEGYQAMLEADPALKAQVEYYEAEMAKQEAADLERLKEVETLISEIVGNSGVVRSPLIEERDRLREITGQSWDAANRKFVPMCFEPPF